MFEAGKQRDSLGCSHLLWISHLLRPCFAAITSLTFELIGFKFSHASHQLNRQYLAIWFVNKKGGLSLSRDVKYINCMPNLRLHWPSRPIGKSAGQPCGAGPILAPPTGRDPVGSAPCQSVGVPSQCGQWRRQLFSDGGANFSARAP